MGRTILIDADILAFQVASSQEQVFDFNGEHVLHADLKKGIEEVKSALERVLETTDSDDASLFLTSPNNFRKTVLASYKGNRTNTRRPMILTGLRNWMLENTRCFLEDTLEGDDLIGIHATMPHKGERVVYSADKDLRTVPGLHWDSEDGEVIEVSRKDADRFFHEQILTGDPTDNYAGCPGVGKVAATEMLENPFKWVEEKRILKSGPNKGEERVTWKKEPVEVRNFSDLWSCIVSAYQKAGLNEKDALQQARCARILRHGEYDFKAKKVILWTPN
jgi:DNA polymerase-1